jgi:hypothetical protein
MRQLKLFVALFIALILMTVFTVVLPFSTPTARAQEPTPTGECVPITGTFHLNNYVGGYRLDDYGAQAAENTEEATGITDTVYARFWNEAGRYSRYSWSLSNVVSGSMNIYSYLGAHRVTNIVVNPNLNASPLADGWVGINLYTGYYSGTVGSVGYETYGPVMGGDWSYLDAADIVLNGCYYTVLYQPCPTVPDYHFTNTPTNTWTLDGSASILSSTLTLNPTGSASQNLSATLQISTTYNAVISVTNAVSSPVVVMLGSQSQTLTIGAPGLYTATFTATEAITSPSYLLRNDGESEHFTDIDWTCVYTGSAITSTAITCLAPINGDFTIADHWNFYRGAAFNSPSQNALLPYNQGSDSSRSLVVSSEVYSLPALTAGEYLVLRFTGASQTGQEALVASRVLSNWNEFQLTSSEPVTFYADISSQAGLNATISFANSGSASSAEQCQYAAQDGLLIDNVCIYVSNTPVQDTAVVTNTFCPVDLGFDFGCNDVDALLAGYGINVYAVEPIYNAGATWADPAGYIPWLAAALWMHVGKPICCFLVEFMRLVVDLVEYEVNVFANFTGWDYQTISTAAPWLQTGLGKIPVYSGLWSNWNANSAKNVLQNTGTNGIYQTLWSQSANQTQASSVGCLQSTVSGGFNGLGSGLGSAISQVMNTFSDVWNNSILVYLSLSLGSKNSIVPITSPAVPDSPWSKVLDMFLWLIQFVGQIVSTVWELLRWLVNFLTTGATAPIDAYHSFVAGMSSEAYVVDVACVADNWWCVFWAGVALIDQTTSQSIMYPIVITGVILLTLVIVFKNLYEMFHIDIS